MKSQYQLGVSNKRFKITKFNFKHRFIQLYTRRFPIIGGEMCNCVLSCIARVIYLIGQRHVKLENYLLIISLKLSKMKLETYSI